MKHSAPKTTPEQVSAFYAFLRSRGRGQAHAIKALELANRLGLTGSREAKERQMRALHNACIESQRAVCSGNAGYWIPASMAEVQESTRRWRSQAADMNRKAQLLEEAAARELSQPVPARPRKTQPDNQMVIGFSV